MATYDREELAEALRALVSTLGKCKRTLPRLRAGTAQRTLLVRRIKALQIACALIRREMRAARRR